MCNESHAPYSTVEYSIAQESYSGGELRTELRRVRYLLSSSSRHCAQLLRLLCRFALKSSGLYLSHYRSTNPDSLASPGEGKPAIKGDVYVHFSTKVHPTAKVLYKA